MAEYILNPSDNPLSREQFLETLILRRGHDYGNSFTIIKQTLRTFSGEEDLSEEDVNLFKTANHALDHIENINFALDELTISRVNYESFNLRQPLESMFRFLKPKYQDIGDIITTSCEEEIKVITSRTILYQQIYSFVSNAIKSYAHDAEDKRIELSAKVYPLREEEIQYLGKNATIMSPSQPFVEISVKDHGMGIEEERLPRIFNPGGSTRGTKGIGLALSKKSAELLCGYVHVESTPNQGSIFSLRFHQNGGLI